jgi:hypothetical protein
VNEREVGGPFSLVTNEQPAEEIVPAVGSLDDPPARLSAHAPDEWLLASPSNVWDDASIADFAFGVGVVEAFVQAEVRGPTRPARCPKDDGVQRRAGHPLVVDIRCGDLDGDGNAASVGQDVAFGAEFCAIGRMGARVVPPFGAFTLALSSEHHFRSTPTRSS